jgi:ATP synthase protein I
LADDAVAQVGGIEAIRVVLRWMAYVTVAAALLAWVVYGPHGAVSALLGGFVNVLAGTTFAWAAARGRARTAGEILHTVVRAEILKIALIICLLGIVFVYYRQVVSTAFFGTFFLTVVLFTGAILIRDR